MIAIDQLSPMYHTILLFLRLKNKNTLQDNNNNPLRTLLSPADPSSMVASDKKNAVPCHHPLEKCVASTKKHTIDESKNSKSFRLFRAVFLVSKSTLNGGSVVAPFAPANKSNLYNGAFHLCTPSRILFVFWQTE